MIKFKEKPHVKHKWEVCCCCSFSSGLFVTVNKNTKDSCFKNYIYICRTIRFSISNPRDKRRDPKEWKKKKKTKKQHYKTSIENNSLSHNSSQKYTKLSLNNSFTFSVNSPTWTLFTAEVNGGGSRWKVWRMKGERLQMEGEVRGELEERGAQSEQNSHIRIYTNSRRHKDGQDITSSTPSFLPPPPLSPPLLQTTPRQKTGGQRSPWGSSAKPGARGTHCLPPPRPPRPPLPATRSERWSSRSRTCCSSSGASTPACCGHRPRRVAPAKKPTARQNHSASLLLPPPPGMDTCSRSETSVSCSGPEADHGADCCCCWSLQDKLGVEAQRLESQAGMALRCWVGTRPCLREEDRVRTPGDGWTEGRMGRRWCQRGCRKSMSAVKWNVMIVVYLSSGRTGCESVHWCGRPHRWSLPLPPHRHPVTPRLSV